MTAIRKVVPARGFDICEIPVPEAASGEVFVAVEAAGLCGTDLHIVDWTLGYESMTGAMPVTLGHEFAGRAIDGPPGLRGRRVVVRPSTVCAACVACGKRRHDDCSKRRGIGIHRNGGFAPFAIAPADNCIPVDEDLDAEIAALTEPLTVGIEAVRRSGLASGERLLIIGPGPIGAMAAMAAKAIGPAAIVIAGRNDHARLAVLRRAGFLQTFDTADRDLGSQLAEAGIPARFERVIEAAGSAAAVVIGLDMLAPGGVLTVAGIHTNLVEIDLTALVRKGLDLRGSYRAAVGDWPEAIALLQSQPEHFRSLITHRCALSSANEAFAAMRRREAMKVMFMPETAA
jgi:threonine 3-dehydrogenase